MAGYSATATAKKLGVKDHGELILVHPEPGWPGFEVPPTVTVKTLASIPAELDGCVADTTVLAFFRNANDYLSALPSLASAILPQTALWTAWPRRAAGHVSDLTDAVIRDAALKHGLVDNKVASIDEDWSGLRFTWRKELRTHRAKSQELAD